MASFIEWWRSVYRKPTHDNPEPPAEPRVEPFTDEGGRELAVGFMVRIYEDGQDITDLLRDVRLEMANGEVRRGQYVVDIGSGLRRKVRIERG